MIKLQKIPKINIKKRRIKMQKYLALFNKNLNLITSKILGYIQENSQGQKNSQGTLNNKE